MADLPITVCNMTRMISIVLVGFEWPTGGTFGLLLCKINSSVPFVSLLVSTLTFAFIALDRFLAVFVPLRRPVTRRVTAGIIAFSWILPCCCYYLLFYYSRLTEIQGKIYCANFLVSDHLENTGKLPNVFNLRLYFSNTDSHNYHNSPLHRYRDKTVH